MIIILPLYPRGSEDRGSEDRDNKGQGRGDRNGSDSRALWISEEGAKLPNSGDLKYIPPSSYEGFDRQRDGLERYRQRDYQRLDEEGQETLFMERRLQEQFGAQNFQDFPPQMGQQVYKESNWRRFSIIFFLAWPFTALYSYGILFSVKALGNEGAALSREESWGLAGVSALLAALIGWYDYREAKMTAFSAPIHPTTASSEQNSSAAARQVAFLQSRAIAGQQAVGRQQMMETQEIIAGRPDLRSYNWRCYYIWSYPLF